MARLTNNSVNPCSINSSWCDAPTLLRRYISFHCSPLDDCTHPQQRCDETCQCHSTMSPALFQQRAEDIHRDVTKTEIFLFYFLTVQCTPITQEKHSVSAWVHLFGLWFCCRIGPNLRGFQALMGWNQQRIWCARHSLDFNFSRHLRTCHDKLENTFPILLFIS